MFKVGNSLLERSWASPSIIALNPDRGYDQDLARNPEFALSVMLAGESGCENRRFLYDPKIRTWVLQKLARRSNARPNKHGS
jgi:hypothetical protein